MKQFQYVTANSAEGAVELVGNSGRYLAGGTDLLGELKDFVIEPDRLVNIKELPGIDTIVQGESSWSVGANTILQELASHTGIMSAFPGLAEATERVGSPQIRNMGTVGGNLAQHSRCWYYRHRDIKCLKNKGVMCYAREGENKYHSLFSGNPCISPVVSNLAVILTALDATATVRRKGGILKMSMEELYQDAWFNPYAHNSLKNADLILSVEIPLERPSSAYLQVTGKADFDWALVSCAAAGMVKGGVLRKARVALGAISNIPHQSADANRFLEGIALDEDTAAQAADILLQGSEPQQHNRYKISLAHTLIRRTLLSLH